MRKLFALAALTLAAVNLHATESQRLYAGSLRATSFLQKGSRVVISNDANSISASRFSGDIREALVSLTSFRMLPVHPYGAVLFDSSAQLAPAGPVPAYLAALITEAARTHGLDPRLVAAVATRESAFNPRAVSPVGACGVMQLMPQTAAYLGVGDVFDARQNVSAGTRYLRRLLDVFHGDLDLALAAYNAGPGAVRRYKGVPPYPETQAYVAAVRTRYELSLHAR